ncbi:PREDICTED: receptor-like protein kinase FERONIA [Theobroma cacao]|uniref:Receptor-like protein kinase FERONIA n=1 Tax=Theobroma cacao TaxID=3641 RepID=A0AB32WBG6_THECC|nr:PREDICTED: receptor-like protein kinase FERONIA [Theobroma cacao]
MISPSKHPVLHFHISTPLLFIFFFFFFFFLNYLKFTNANNIFLNCGTSTNSIGLDGHEWTGDSGTGSKFIASEQSNDTSIVSKSIKLESSIDPVPFRTARIFQSPFTYSFRVRPRQKFLRLYFNPRTYQEFPRSTAFFSVTAGPFTLLSNFSPSLTADSLGLQTLVKEFCLNIEENQVLNITFSPSSTPLGAYAFINAIEIVSMPTNLYYGGSGARRIHGSGLRNRFAVENNTALEMILRLNIGGGSILPANDSGLYRGWLEDSDYFRGSGDRLVNATVRIKYLKTAPYVAPANVYQTARSTNKQKSLSWNMTVDSGFTYLLRLHLCELQPEVTKHGSRKVLISIRYGKTEAEADVITWGAGRGIAVYRDYIVKVPNVGNSGNVDLVISLGNNTKLRNLNSDPILNGLEVFKLNDSEGNLAGPNPGSRTASIPSPLANKPKDRKSAFVIGWATLAAFSLILLSGLTIFCLLRKGKSNAKDKSVSPRGPCRRFTLDELRAATNNFDRELVIGNGGFGRVFKGCIDGETPVAIKALKPTSTQGSNEFEAEIEMLSDLRHPYLVSLIGYCDEGIKIIVYDYMPRGTLRDHLYSTQGPPLSWKQRLEICIGVARGLAYLHAKNPKIIHRDIKPSNILLDKNWVAKVSDFGLSRLGPTSLSRSHVTTGVKGTFGYLDPDYFQTNHLSVKSDVYSFGVVLFEVLCARPAVDLRQDDEQQSLAEWVRQCIKAGKLNRIIDHNLKGEIAPECLKMYASIALKCLNDDRYKRPTMAAVLKRLKHALELQESTDAASDEEIMSSNGMEIVLRPNNNSKVVIHSCPTFWNKTISHKELFRFVSDRTGMKWARPPAQCGLKALCCAVPAYGALSFGGRMSNSSDCGLDGTPGRVMDPILLDDDDTFKL